MLFVVFGADCDHVGDIYECPQGTYAIGHRAPLQNNFIYIHKNTNNKDICNTNNKLFMILYNCNFMMYSRTSLQRDSEKRSDSQRRSFRWERSSIRMSVIDFKL